MRRWGMVAVAAMLAACGGTGDDVDGDGNQPGEATTFTELRMEVFATCNSSLCHATASEETGGVIIRQEETYAQEVYDNLVNAPVVLAAGRAQAAMRVVPGEPAKSFLYWKLLGHAPGDPNTAVAGLHMPNVCARAPCLSEAQLEMVRSWIAAGAKND